MTQETEWQQLQRIKRRIELISPGIWQRTISDSEQYLEAKDDRGDMVTIAHFTPQATFDEVEFLSAAPTMISFLIGLVDRAIDAQRKASKPAQQAIVTSQQQDQGKDKNFTAEAAMKCSEPAFKAFLHERHGLERPLTDERVTQKLRSMLGIVSRTELNKSEVAAARWKSLRDEFETWRRTG